MATYILSSYRDSGNRIPQLCNFPFCIEASKIMEVKLKVCHFLGWGDSDGEGDVYLCYKNTMAIFLSHKKKKKKKN